MKPCSGQIKYLIAIKEIADSGENVRCVTISRHLGVSRPSVSKMLRGLVSRGYVHEDFCSSVTLTPEGRKAVDEIFSCFTEVYMFFHKFLGLPHEEAHEQAVTFITTFHQDTCERLQGIVKRTVKKRRVGFTFFRRYLKPVFIG